jgi:hypothetical protein
MNTPDWLERQIPLALSQNAFRRKISLNSFDAESITQAYCYLVSGVCFSLALKYAGTWNESTANIIVGFISPRSLRQLISLSLFQRTYFKQFQVYIDRPSDAADNTADAYVPDSSTLEFVVSTLVLSLAMVRAFVLVNLVSSAIFSR